LRGNRDVEVLAAYIYIYRERERERERQTDRQRQREKRNIRSLTYVTRSSVSLFCAEIYRVIREEKSIFLEVIVSVIVRKNRGVHMIKCQILKGYNYRLI
jgi:hypothetical protein